jgi:hypothetical protein
MLCYDACAPVVNFCICGQGKGVGSSKKRKKGDGDGVSSSRASAVASAIDVALKEGNWHTKGSSYIGRGALQTLLLDNGQSSEFCGQIIGWRSADESDFVDDQGNPAALWRVMFEFEDMIFTSEDFEEYEINAAVKKVRMRLCCVLVLLWCTHAYVLFDQAEDQAKLIGGHGLEGMLRL